MKLSRRRMMQALAAAGAVAPFGFWPGRRAQALAGEPHRFLHIVLRGAWNAQLSVDPAFGARATNGHFDPIYQTHDIVAPDGKPTLMTGLGFQPALAAFASVNTAFVSGLYVDVPAHDTAADFMYTGRSTIGETSRYPAIGAHLGAAFGGFPPHVVIGSKIPLGDTSRTTAPLVAENPENLSALLAGPGAGFTAQSMEEAGRLIRLFDEKFFASLPQAAADSLESWRKAQKDLDAVYLKGLADDLRLVDSVKERYGFKGSWDLEAMLATAYLTFKADLTRVVSINFGGFDTHAGEIANQLPMQERVATALQALVDDLRATPDPADTKLALSETTTILVSSEFVRTPIFNGAAGTDHWRAGAAIVMGKGIRNGRVGATDEKAAAAGWRDGAQVPFSPETAINYGHLIATLLQLFGLKDEANAISEEKLDDLLA